MRWASFRDDRRADERREAARAALRRAARDMLLADRASAASPQLSPPHEHAAQSSPQQEQPSSPPSPPPDSPQPLAGRGPPGLAAQAMALEAVVQGDAPEPAPSAGPPWSPPLAAQPSPAPPPSAMELLRDSQFSEQRYAGGTWGTDEAGSLDAGEQARLHSERVHTAAAAAHHRPARPQQELPAARDALHRAEIALLDERRPPTDT
jgi:hypothetical protein